MQTLEDFWRMVLDGMEGISQTELAAWFDEVEPVALEDRTLMLYCPVPFKQKSIEEYYIETLRKSLRRLLSDEADAHFLDENEYARRKSGCEKRASLQECGAYSFETFVVGNSNHLAYTAARAVAKGHARYSNPLVIYGGPGLGKTHLLNAIAMEVKRENPSASIVSIKGDDFTNYLVEAIQSKTGAAFREKYRSADVFLMDDMQFIAGKKQTQEEFYNTFDTLYQAQCRIVLALDRPLCELVTLEERLRSRFEGGLLVEITEPDYETRLEIIKSKAAQRGISLTSQEMRCIAEQACGSVRRIEGVLNQLRMMRELQGETLVSLETVVERSLGNQRSALTAEEIIEKVARAYQLEPDALKGRGRSRNVTSARQTAMYLMCRKGGMSTTQVGKVFGRDHSTVMYSLRCVAERMKLDPDFGERVRKLSSL